MNMKIIIIESQLKRIISETRNKEEDRVKIYHDENLVVVAPLTHSSSCKYGAYTKWCTSVPSNDEHFNDYIKDGVLIYFIVRSPYKKNKDYKFAYYHPFSEDGDERKGWYDMSDNQLNFDSESNSVDFNLIKFLIPDEVIKMVQDYIKTQKPIWMKRLKETRTKVADNIINDVHNTVNTIVNDNSWFISYITTPFDNYGNDFPYIYIQPSSTLTILYVNKKTKEIYSQNLNFYQDLRNYEFKGSEFLPPIKDLYKNKHSEKMIEVFDKYYPQILKSYFKVRKENYKPNNNSYLYMPPQYVEKGDIVGGDYKVHDISTENGRFVINTIDSKGNLNKNIYYNDKYGVGMKYDKDKHNPINF